MTEGAGSIWILQPHRDRRLRLVCTGIGDAYNVIRRVLAYLIAAITFKWYILDNI